MSKKVHRSPVTTRERALDDIYREIPKIPDCTGQCSPSCGPIAMFKGEYDRLVRVSGKPLRLKPGTLECSLLSPTGRCMAYTVRPFICRLWGTTPEMRCPWGCQPERWLTREEAHELFARVQAIAGPENRGTVGSGDLEDLWQAIGLEDRERRSALIHRLKEHHGRTA